MNAPLPWTPTEPPADAVELGRLGAPWGVKGWLKLIPYSADADVLLGARAWVLHAPAGRFGKGFTTFSGAVQVDVRECKVHGDGLVVRLHGLDDRDIADRLKGCSVWVSRAAFPKLPDDEYYWVDLIGSSVVNREGVALGTVEDLMATGPTSVLVVKAEARGEEAATERLIPFVPVYVDRVDVAAKHITVDWQPDY
jgi:16S rRNA processing protein RimM